MKILERWAEIVVRRRRAVVGTVLAVTALAAYGARGVRLNADFSTYLSRSNPLVRVYDYVGDAFGNNSIGVVLLTAPDVYRPDVLETVDRLTEAYRQVDGIAYVTSLTNVVDFRRSFGGIEVGRLVAREELPRSEEESRRLEARVRTKDRLLGTLVSEDGTATAIMLRFGERGGADGPAEYETADRVKTVTDSVTASEGVPAGAELYFGGMPFLVYNMTRLIAENMTVLTPLMIGVLLLVLWVGVRRWGGVFHPLGVVLVSTVWTLGLMGLVGADLDLLTGIMPVILIALGSADGIHFMKRFYERTGAGDAPPIAARTSLVEMGVPLVLTTLTTMVGFASLAISDFAVIRQFGLLTAVGLFFALVVTLTLLPALASWGAGGERPSRVGRGGGNPVSEGLTRLVHRRPGAILAGSGVVAIVALFAIPRIVKDVDWTLCLQKGSTPFHAEMLLREKFGGSLPIQVLVEGDLKDPVTLTATRAVERRLGALPLANGSQSVAGVIAEMNEVLNGRYAVPSDPRGVANLWFLVEDEELMEQLVTDGARQGLVQARLADWTTASVSEAVDSLTAFLAAFPSRLAVVDPGAVPEKLRPAVGAARRRDVARALQLDMARRDVTVSARAVEASLVSFFEWEPGEDELVRLAAELRAYLTSPESEIPVAPDRAGVLASSVVEAWRSSPTGPGSLEPVVATALPGADPLDAEYLALSLRLLGEDVMGRARVEATLAGLEFLAPALGKDPIVRRDVRGTLWEASGPLWAVDAREAEALGIADGDAVIRTVEARFGRAGMASVLDEMEEELVPTQVSSILLTLTVVVVVLGLVFHTVLGGLLALAPLVLTILVNFAAMGYLGVGLDAFTAMVASIAVGLGIDYAIHFTHRFRREWARSAPDVERTLRETFATSGVAILVNATSVGLGFLVLLAAGGQHIRRFGGLSALTMFVAGALTLTLLPALFVRLRPRFATPEPGGRESRGTTVEEDTMRRRTTKGSIGVVALLLALVPAGLGAQEGQAILERVDSVLNAPRDVSAVERMTLVDDDGSRKERLMRYRQKGAEKRIMHFVEPADVRGVGFLRLAEDRMYLYLPAFRRVRRIASSIENEDFMGTDFSYEDMSLTRYGEDYRVTAVEGDGGDEGYRLTLEPRPDADVGYARLVMEVSVPDWVARKVDFYGADGERTKTLTSSDVERIDGYWFAKRLEMVSWDSGHRTVLELEDVRFDTGLTDDVFSERSLKRPR